MKNSIALKYPHLCLNIKNNISNDHINSYKLNITKISPRVLYLPSGPFSYKTCAQKGHTLFMLIILPETQVAFFL